MKYIKSYETTEEFINDVETRTLFPHLMYDKETDTLLSEHEPNSEIAFTIDTNPELIAIARNSSWIGEESTAMTVGECGQILTLKNIDFKSLLTFNELVNFISLNKIENGIFKDCTKLTDIKFSDFISQIESEAFRGCVALKEIEINKGINFIGGQAFYGCTELEKVIIKNETPFEIGGGVFDETTCKIIVPKGKVMDYSMASEWSNYADRIEEE